MEWPRSKEIGLYTQNEEHKRIEFSEMLEEGKEVEKDGLVSTWKMFVVV